MTKREQVTGYQIAQLYSDPTLPSPLDSEYFEYESISTGLSTATCTYGYRNQETGEWVKIKDAKG